MICRKCREEIPEGSKYCNRCGAKQEADKAKRRTRANGQGTAIKRGNTWTAIWTTEIFINGDGEKKTIHQKRRWKGGFRTKSAALAYAANPQPEMKKSPTLRSYWKGWEASELPMLSPSKQTAYKIAWSKLEGLAGTPMDVLTIDMLQGCVDKEATTYYPARDMKTLLSHLYKRAVAEGNARTNLSEYIRLPKLDEKEMQPFTEQELHTMWQAYSKGDRFLGFVLLMIYTGMMPGELLRLTPDMIDWEKQEIIGVGLKTKKRKVTPLVFPDILTPVLTDLVVWQQERKVKYIVGMQKDKFYAIYHDEMKKIGIRDLPPYSCRHTTATALALGNISPSVIQEVMRHTKFSTTQRYIHPDREAAAAAVNTLGMGKEDTTAVET